MAYQVTALYNRPPDEDSFDKHYWEGHLPLAWKVPGIQSMTVVKPDPGPDGTDPTFYLAVTMTFDSRESYDSGMRSEQGAAAARDLENFASAGFIVLAGVVIEERHQNC